MTPISVTSLEQVVVPEASIHEVLRASLPTQACMFTRYQDHDYVTLTSTFPGLTSLRVKVSVCRRVLSEVYADAPQPSAPITSSYGVAGHLIIDDTTDLNAVCIPEMTARLLILLNLRGNPHLYLRSELIHFTDHKTYSCEIPLTLVNMVKCEFWEEQAQAKEEEARKLRHQIAQLQKV